MNSSTFEQYLDKYAEVAVKIGLNLQPGQRLLIGTPMFDGLAPIDAAPLVRLVAAHAYRAGAPLVDILWGDDQLKPLRMRNAPPDSFEEFPAWQVATTLEYIRRGDAILMIFAHDPDLMQGQDPQLLGRMEHVTSMQTAPIFDYIGKNATNWLVIAAPVPGWAAKLFPGSSPASQDAKLWDILFDICRVKHPDPVAAWQAHVGELARRSQYLNRKQYAAVKLTAPGTDLTIGLPANHVWRSGQMTDAKGIPFTANIPTEEIFTLPHREKINGTVTATRPLSFGGGLVEKFSLTFSEGRVVKLVAGDAEENLRQLLATDPGACSLGEVALVPHSSPISQSGLVFYNILIDENASSHLALGHAYKFSIDKGEGLSDDEFTAAGGNLSAIHMDFMVGSGDMDVDGLRPDGRAEPIMRNGEWAFD